MTRSNDTAKRRVRSIHRACAKMRALLLISLFVIVYFAAAAPAKSKLQTGTNDTDGQPFVEEVVVESVLHIRSPSSRQARTNTQTSLQDGTRVAEAKIYH